MLHFIDELIEKFKILKTFFMLIFNKNIKNNYTI